MEGKTEPPPDPGRYDPVTGGSEAQGAESGSHVGWPKRVLRPLPGETTEQYNARQAWLLGAFRGVRLEAKLREEARERLRQKFGNGSMSSAGGHRTELHSAVQQQVGSHPQPGGGFMDP